MPRIKRQPTVRVCIALLAARLLCIVSAGAEEHDDPVLSYYLDRAADVNEAGDPVQHGVSFAFTATSYYQTMSSNGYVEKVDSAISRRFYSFGQLDSVRVDAQTTGGLDEVALVAPNVFGAPYEFGFYPNDTGGTGLAIGFDTDSLDDPRPTGLAIIDRDTGLLRKLHLFYPHRERHQRISRTFLMAEKDGYVFPDSVWQVGVKAGVFSVDAYRLVTGISDLEIVR